MKYNNFQEWFESLKYQDYDISRKVKDLMLEAWDAAVENYPEDTTRTDIIEKQKIITATLAIECTCDQAQIKHGYMCGCGKAAAVNKAIMDLTKYLRALK
jgi:predicted AlkP superfamily pyrophosphatase or phosphodiesterase